jgi:phosphoglycolate phosphatase
MLKIRRPIPPGNTRLLIFDLDGTLVDSRVDLANSINAMLRHFGRPELPCEVIANFIGDGAPMLVRRALGDPDDEQFFKDAIQFFLDWYREHKLDNTYVYPGIMEALDRLRTAADGTKRKMAVLSNKPVNPSRAIVDALGLGKYFFQVYGGNSFHTKKPDPLGALQLAQEAGVRPEQSVVIGDSHNDVLTAHNAGMWSLGLSYGLAPQSLDMTPPDILVDTPGEIPLAFEPGAETAAGGGQSGDVEPPSPS